MLVKFRNHRQQRADDWEQDGKPYIVNVTVGPAEKHNLSQGYTVVCKTEFASMDDMKYYEDECAAHGEIKTLMGTLECDGVLTVYFRPTATGGTSQGI